MKIACVAIVKDEARHIAEWLAWQFCAGFDAVLLFDNGSTDRTAAIARAFAPAFDVRVQDWPNRTPRYQLWAYEFAARNYAGEFDWLAFFDTDEFLVLDDGLDLKALLARRVEPAVGIPWAIFGSSGHTEIPNELVIEAFIHRAEPEFPPNRHYKSIIRPGQMRACLSPHSFDCGAEIVDLFGEKMAQEFTGYLAAPPVYRGAKVHHYFTRSRAHWVEKLNRGYPDTSRPESEFEAYDRNEVADASAAARAPAVRALLSRLTPSYQYAICACARWETPYIVEWLTYHRAIGFEHVYLYCNDDDPVELYERVLPFIQGPAPFVTFTHHALQGEQSQMYSHFLRHHLGRMAWISFLDIDEFLRLPPGETIAGFMRRFAPEVDSVLFNWIFFGPNGHKTPPASVLAGLTRRERNIHELTKHVSRACLLTGAKLHDPTHGNGYWHGIVEHVDVPVKAVNVLGEDMRSYHSATTSPEARNAFVREPARRERLLDTAMVHHYAFRSEAAFLERVARGTKGNFFGQVMWKELAEGPHFEGNLNNFNAVEDRRLAEFRLRLLEPARLKTLASKQAERVPLSRHKQAWMSSRYVDLEKQTASAPPETAVNGSIDGTRKFHTALEDNPWWMVDLGAFRTITEVHVYNTVDHTAHRCRNISLEVSIDGRGWAELVRKTDDQVVGGVTTGPFIWAGPGTAWARFVRVTLLDRGFLHLDQVEVFGP